jgi:fatty acid desaturase
MLATETIGYSLNLPNHIINHDFTYIPWYNLSSWTNEYEKNQNVQNENDNNIHTNYENFTVDKNSSNQ